MKEQLPLIPFEKLSYHGLTSQKAADQKAAGFDNVPPPTPGKSWWQIIAAHLFTFFNLINVILAAALLLVGSYQNILFMGVVICNTFIGALQELRAKKTVDSLQLLASPDVLVVRNKQPQWIKAQEVVVDDLLAVFQGDQLTVDGVMIGGQGAVNESLLTGESDPVDKKTGDVLLSGSFLVEGTVYMEVTKVGAQAYGAQVTLSAKEIKAPKSELMTDMNKLIKIMSWILFPVGILLFLKQFFWLKLPLTQAVPASVAAMIGMIPEGLMLLVSLALTVGVVKLSKKNALAQDIYALESLARVDVLCVDKTGTLTQGNMSVAKVVPLEGDAALNEAMGHLLTGLADSNLTFKALQNHFTAFEGGEYKAVPFSSQRKWSGVYSPKTGSYVMGAPSYVFPQGLDEGLTQSVKDFVAQGYRVLAVAHSLNPFEEKNLPPGLRPLGFILLYDQLREDAKETIEYFTNQGVRVCVISGDDPTTVSLIGRKLGLPGAESAIDATGLTDEAALAQAAKTYQVFGRVAPEQKKQLIMALKSQGHTVAMIGDGVNDVPALKACDCSIAMAGGSSAAEKTARIVLMDGRFSSLPAVIMEGRRVINNVGRTASLFLVKTLFSALLAFLLLFLPMQYPFEPIQMTLISSLFVGIPSFFLALEPNHSPVKGRFLKTVFHNALPGALTIVVLIGAIFALSKGLHFTQGQEATVTTWVTGATYFWILLTVCYPFSPLRLAILTVSAAAFIFAMFLLAPLLGLVYMGKTLVIVTMVLAAIAPVLLFGMRRVVKKASARA